MKLMTTLLATCLLLSNSGWADDDDGTNDYKVTVTNLTLGQSFTPLLAASHKASISFFELGEPASDALADLAEGGATGPLETWLLDHPRKVLDINITMGMLGPGESVSFRIEGSKRFHRFSMAGMLLPTNDTFVAVNSIRLPKKSTTIYAKAYDAGSEDNDESCDSIPGPTCMGSPFSAGQAEGYVFISNGIHGQGDLSPEVYDWRNPVARVTIKRVRSDNDD